MPRPKTLPEGERISITLPFDLIAILKGQADQQSCSLSAVVDTLLRKGLQLGVEESRPLPEFARSFPPGWDGKDLRQRLIDLRFLQKDLAKALSKKLNYFVSAGSISHWSLGKGKFPEWSLEPIQEILRTWDPATNPKFRIGSRSPEA